MSLEASKVIKNGKIVVICRFWFKNGPTDGATNIDVIANSYQRNQKSKFSDSDQNFLKNATCWFKIKLKIWQFFLSTLKCLEQTNAGHFAIEVIWTWLFLVTSLCNGRSCLFKQWQEPANNSNVTLTPHNSRWR